ncbi:MAG: SDR family oxidoreductase [Candidatus Methanoperedens sp.]|nr:SDR family oxidoreductase [Candidatus Methanoperedens sp.]MCZ7394231.1 SDR family oxidoreductase [Candidatus Methanoperedens sp.]
MEETILVTGATGTVGIELVEQLKNKANVRACYHSRKPDVDGVEWVELDYSKPKTIEAAFKNIDSAFLLTPFSDKTVEFTKILVKYARMADLNNIVRSSAMGADKVAPHNIGRWHWQAEQLIKESGISYTIIRPAFFMQNFINSYGQTIREQNSIYSSAGNGKAGFIDARDVASVAVEVLTCKGHENKIYELTGPEAISYAEAAGILTEVLGRKINYIDLSEEKARKSFEKSGLPEWMIEALLGLAIFIKNGHAAKLTHDVEKITGTKPRTFKQFIKDHASAF